MSQPAPEPSPPAPVFAALGDATRLGLVAALADGRPRSLSTLAEGTVLTRQAVAKHLGVLEAAGVVARARAGRETRFAFRPEALTGARDYLDDVARQWDAALARLKAFAEE